MYTTDLRHRVIWLKFAFGMHTYEIAGYLNMSSRTVQRIIEKFTRTGLLTCEAVGRPVGCSLHDHEQLVLMESILENPTLTMIDIQYEIERETGSVYHCTTLLRNLVKFGISRKLVSTFWTCIFLYYVGHHRKYHSKAVYQNEDVQNVIDISLMIEMLRIRMLASI